MTALDIQIAVARLFNWRQHIIVPNVSWGIGLRHEADLIVMSKAGFAKEIEIKISASDIKADARKGAQYEHGPRVQEKLEGLGLHTKTGYDFHMEGPIRQLYFAVPEELADNPNIPEKAGIIKVFHPPKYSRCFAKIIRQATIRKDATPLNDAQIKHLLHLGCMRIWSLKEHMRKGKVA